MVSAFVRHSFKFFGFFLIQGLSRRKVGHKSFHVFFTMAVIAIVDAAILFHTVQEYILQYVNSAFKNTTVQKYSNILECLCIAIFYTVCAARATAVQNQLYQIRTLLDKVERSLQIKGLLNVKQIGVFLILFYTMWILLSIFEISIRVKRYGTFQFIHVFKQYAQLYLSLCAFTFVYFVLPIYKLFQSLNNKLVNILKQSNNKGKTDELSNYRRNLTLDRLSNSHWDLCDAMSKLDEAFGLHLLLIIFYVYIKCITNPYKFIASVFFSQIDDMKIQFSLVYFSWIILYFSIAVVVFKACTDTTIEAGKTNIIIWDNIDQHHNLPLTKKLMTFSTKSNYHSKFTACGFFILELNTLSSMLLSITTQLVILFSIVKDD